MEIVRDCELTLSTTSVLSVELPHAAFAIGDAVIARASIPRVVREPRVITVVNVLKDAPGTPVGDGRPRAVFKGSALPCGWAPTV